MKPLCQPLSALSLALIGLGCGLMCLPAPSQARPLLPSRSEELKATPVRETPLRSVLAEPLLSPATADEFLYGRVSVVGGSYLMLDQTDSLWGWGLAAYGALGPTFDDVVLEPTLVPGVPALVAITSDSAATVGIDTQGQLWLWGFNTGLLDPAPEMQGQVLAPSVLPGLPPARRVYCAGTAIVVLTEDGALWGWGTNLPGWDLQEFDTPFELMAATPDGIPFESVTQNGGQTVGTWFALDTLGRVWHWPAANQTALPVAPTQVTGIPAFRQIASASDVVLGLDLNGNVWSWSTGGVSSPCNNLGRAYTDTQNPNMIPGLSQVEHLSVSYQAVLAVRSDRQVWGWGCNEGGVLGTGDLTDARGTPTPLPFLEGMRWLVQDSSTAFGAKDDGTLQFWGSNWFGAKGDGSSSLHPWAASAFSGTPRQVVSGTYINSGYQGRSSLMLDQNGKLWGTGFNLYGELGDGTYTARSVWTSVVTPSAPDQRFVQVTSNGSSSAALTAQGQVWTWGDNRVGQLGDDASASRPTPQPLTGLTQIVKIQPSKQGFVALDSSGQVWAWGASVCGMDGGIPQHLDLGQLKVAINLSSLYDHLLLQDSAGKLWAMGNNDELELGVPGRFDRCKPVQVRGLPTIVSFHAGVNSSFLLDSRGRVWAWGNNDNGELGQGASGEDQWQPVQVKGLPTVTALSAGFSFATALDSTGSVWFWGRDDFASTGIREFVDRPTPTRLSVDKAVAEVFAGMYLFYRHSDNSLGCSGVNEYGELGLGAHWMPTPVEASFDLGE